MRLSQIIDYLLLFGAFATGYYMGSADGLMDGYSMALEAMANGVHDSGL